MAYTAPSFATLTPELVANEFRKIAQALAALTGGSDVIIPPPPVDGVTEGQSPVNWTGSHYWHQVGAMVDLSLVAADMVRRGLLRIDAVGRLSLWGSYDVQATETLAPILHAGFDAYTYIQANGPGPAQAYFGFGVDADSFLRPQVGSGHGGSLSFRRGSDNALLGQIWAKGSTNQLLFSSPWTFVFSDETQGLRELAFDIGSTQRFADVNDHYIEQLYRSDAYGAGRFWYKWYRPDIRMVIEANEGIQGAGAAEGFEWYARSADGASMPLVLRINENGITAPNYSSVLGWADINSAGTVTAGRNVIAGRTGLGTYFVTTGAGFRVAAVTAAAPSYHASYTLAGNDQSMAVTMWHTGSGAGQAADADFHVVMYGA